MSARPRFLYVTPVLPIPADQGSKQLMLQSARLLRAIGEVTWFTRLLPGQEQAVRQLREEGFELVLDRDFTRRALGTRLWRRMRNDGRALRWRRPRELAFSCTPKLRGLVADGVRDDPDAIGVAVFWHCWRALDALPRERRVLILSDVEHLRLAESGASGPLAAWRRRLLRTAEEEAIRACGQVLTISDWDHEAVAEIADAEHSGLGRWPVWIPAQRLRMKAPVADDGIAPRIFIYGRWEAAFNRDGLELWLRDSWPRIRREIPSATLRVAGSGLDGRLGERVGEAGGEFLGWVDDLDAELENSDVVAIPLRYAGGVRYRLLEAMARGCACVCSPVAARGSGAVAGTHYLEAAAPEEWVEALRSCRDAGTLTALGQAAAHFVQERHSEAVATQSARSALAPLISPALEGR